ncbi:MAG: chemotaxis protein CheX [Thermogutta sp.]
MRAEFINPFIHSLHKTFLTMLNCPVERGQLSIKSDSRASYEVSGIIGLTGRAVGAVVLTLSKPVAVKAASTMLLCDFSEINEDVVDAVGELANMVAGAAKAELEEYSLAVSLPNVITGQDHEIHFPSNVTPICIPFSSAWGPLALEVGLTTLQPGGSAGLGSANQVEARASA